MLRIFTGIGLVIFSLQLSAQDSIEKKPVTIFTSDKAINAATTEVTGKGKMSFKVTHDFGDIAGTNGGIKKFFGLDNAFDVRIGFHIGLTKTTDLILARAKGGSVVQSLWELGFKQQLMQQKEHDPSHPLSIALFANAVVSTQTRSQFDNQDNSFSSLSDRISNVVQLIVARKSGKVSLQLSPTFFTRGYAISYDQKQLFALGAAIRLPLANKLNLVIDYFHTFRNQSSKDSFSVNQHINFFDPLGVGFEINTSGHVFMLNFTNATETLPNRFIPRTISSWGKGQFRWGFTMSRKFTLWRPKSK
jgi:hypothetical protein